LQEAVKYKRGLTIKRKKVKMTIPKKVEGARAGARCHLRSLRGSPWR
jgi:hypothetical protein